MQLSCEVGVGLECDNKKIWADNKTKLHLVVLYSEKNHFNDGNENA